VTKKVLYMADTGSCTFFMNFSRAYLCKKLKFFISRQPVVCTLIKHDFILLSIILLNVVAWQIPQGLVS
jgi:hypothetical protein